LGAAPLVFFFELSMALAALAAAALGWNFMADEEVARFAATHAFAGGRVLDVGGMDINGGARKHWENRSCAFTALDIRKHPSVDVVMNPGDPYPFADGHFDFVLATSTFEHDPMFWMTIREMARVTKVGGFVYVNVPSMGPYHPHPGDNWRFYRDAPAALAFWTGKSFAGAPAYPLAVESQHFSFPDQPPDIRTEPVKRSQFYYNLRKTNIWSENVMVWRRTTVPATQFTLPVRMQNRANGFQGEYARLMRTYKGAGACVVK